MTTNQAFIKAFRQDSAQTAAGGPAGGNPSHRPALNGATAPSASTLTTTVPIATVPTKTVQYIAAPNAGGISVNQSQSSSDVWAAAFAETAHVTKPAVPARRIADSSTPARRVDLGAGSKRPLSSFNNRTRERQAPQSHNLGFEPGTKVASFHWPGVCRTLLRQHGPHYDRLADLLLASSAKRSFIGMIGLFPAGGCTTTLLCLAARLAGRGRRVIIVDGNFISPQLAQWLDVQVTATWQDVLTHGAPVADAVVRATTDQLDLLPLNSKTREALALAASPQVSRTAELLRSAYELVLIDLGAFFDAQSQPTLLELVRNLRVNAALAVAGPQAADPRDLATLAEYLGEHGCDLLGAIENRTTK